MRNASIERLKDCPSVGIDVSKANLAIVGVPSGEPTLVPVENKLPGIREVLGRLRDAGYRGKLLCEATGHYHLKLVLVCQELGLELIVVNPLQSSKHSKARIRKVKTDPQDALSLATMGVTEPDLPAPVRMSPSKILIRLKMGQLASVEKLLQQFQQSLNQYEQSYTELGFELSAWQVELRGQLKALKRLKERLEQELTQLLSAHQQTDPAIGALARLPGYSPVVCALVGDLDRQVRGADSWVAYTGLDVSVRQSGMWKGHGKLTKRGNGYLRKRFFQAAWGACLNYDYVRAYYDALKAQGRKHTEAVCIIARKLLRLAYYVLVHGYDFDPAVAFPAQGG